MFTPSDNPGFNPNIGSVMPPDPYEAQFSTSPSEMAEVSWEDRMLIEYRMDKLVEERTLSPSSAAWLTEVGLSNREEAQKLIHRFARPGGFNGPNYNISE